MGNTCGEEDCGKAWVGSSFIDGETTQVGKKTFYKKPDVTKSQQIHIGEKLSECIEDKETFISSSDRIIHQRACREKNPYACITVRNLSPISPSLSSIKEFTQGKGPIHVMNVGKPFPASVT